VKTFLSLDMKLNASTNKPCLVGLHSQVQTDVGQKQQHDFESLLNF